MGEQIEGTSVSPPFTAPSKHLASHWRGWLGADDLSEASHLGLRCLPRTTLLDQGLGALTCPFIPPPLHVVPLCGQAPGRGHLSVTLTFED